MEQNHFSMLIMENVNIGLIWMSYSGIYLMVIHLEEIQIIKNLVHSHKKLEIIRLEKENL